MDLRRLIAFLKRWAWVLVAGTAIAGGAAYAVSSVLAPAPTYEAEALVLVGPALSDANADAGQMEASQRVAVIYVEVATSRPLLGRVIDQLNLDTTPERLAGQVTAETPERPPIITVAATANDPDGAARLANAVVRELIAVSPTVGDEEQQTQDFIKRQIDALESEIESLILEAETLASRTFRTPEQDDRLAEVQNRLASLRSTYASLVAASSAAASNTLTVIQEAAPNPRGLSTGRGRNTIFASLLGLVLAIAVVLVVEHLDDTVRSSDEMEGTVRLPNLAEIPVIPSPRTRNPGTTGRMLAPYSSAAGEAFRSLRTNIELGHKNPVHSLLVTSARRGDGTTTVAVNLAVAFAHAGRHVLLIDADLRSPNLHLQFGLRNERGLSDLLRTADGRPDATLIQRTLIARLNVLAAGPRPPNPAELIGSPRTKELMSTDGQTDLVIIDSPAALTASETAVLASLADATLIVVGAGRTALGDLMDARDALARVTADVIGTVLNRSR